MSFLTKIRFRLEVQYYLVINREIKNNHISYVMYEIQIMLYFLKIFKFNTIICLNSIKQPNNSV